jgi:hypothetical protein
VVRSYCTTLPEDSGKRSWHRDYTDYCETIKKYY